MKKTLIALAVAASAAVSGSAMAWTQGGINGSVNIGGNLNPVKIPTPWEAEIGAAVSGLDTNVGTGTKNVSIRVDNAIPVLGIRTQTADAFVGQAGISPRVSYGDVVDASSYQDSTATMTLDVSDAQGNKIGQLTAPLFTAAEISKKGVSNAFTKLWVVYSTGSDRSFYPGLPRNADQVASGDITARSAALFPEAVQNFNTQSITVNSGAGNTDNFANPDYLYSAYYVSGIEAGKNINIILDNPFGDNGTVAWKATLPVTVSYQ
ncbi:hypothetical protein QNZ28_005037 [Escherichia coli]|nr:hypothetical protein [Escherichia coli]ELT9943441.1 hypothetical protein [Escherichia coli]MEB7340879.1 hypothetical protein [Escherichia coli]MEB7354909.1 hypothetical protein [Escherichia coli]MEB7420253.1 hypothetical protein [Escherichia coli]